MFVYEQSDCVFESCCSYLNFRHHVYFEQWTPWHSGNCWVYTYSKCICDMIKTHSNLDILSHFLYFEDSEEFIFLDKNHFEILHIFRWLNISNISSFACSKVIYKNTHFFIAEIFEKNLEFSPKRSSVLKIYHRKVYVTLPSTQVLWKENKLFPILVQHSILKRAC